MIMLAVMRQQRNAPELLLPGKPEVEARMTTSVALFDDSEAPLHLRAHATIHGLQRLKVEKVSNNGNDDNDGKT